jgi:uncharacterized OB-fold protein
MGLFNRLGREVEKLKQKADTARAEQATHGCENCGELFYSARESCPECSSDAVVEIDTSGSPD